MSDNQWIQIDSYFEKLAHHCEAQFDNVVIGDSIVTLAVYKHAFLVASELVKRGVPLFPKNSENNDLLGVTEKELEVLSNALKSIQNTQKNILWSCGNGIRDQQIVHKRRTNIAPSS